MESDLTVETDGSSACESGSEAAGNDTPGCPEKPAEPQRREQGPDRRLERVDRRVGLDRRVLPTSESDNEGEERRKKEERRTGLERRRGPGRRLSDDRKSAEEGEMSGHQ